MIESQSTKAAWIGKYRGVYAAVMGLLLAFAVSGGGALLGADFIESLLIGGAVLGALAWLISRPAWREVGRRYQFCVLVMVAAVAAGQLLKIDAQSFPFVSWTMYGKSRFEVPTEFRYVATLEDGQEVDFHPGRLLPTLGHQRIESKLKHQITVLERGEAGAKEAMQPQHQRTMEALAEVYSRKHPGASVLQVAVYKLHFLPGKPAADSRPPDRLLWAVRLNAEAL
jgi:hypothetical protein